ncbi:MAG: alpha/beta fold hydrolase [Oscillospiraceae bacterium]|nr:alpha/beta fold hydrolase [Oscillospiraceae bacterium]
MQKSKSKATKLIVALVMSLLLLTIIIACDNNEAPPEEPAIDPIPTEAQQDDPPEPTEVDWEFFNERAVEFINLTASGNYDDAAAMFDETMTEVFGAAGLEVAWAEVIALVGDFIEIHDIENANIDPYFISGVIIRHENSGFGWTVVFDESGNISGLHSGGTAPLSDPTAQNHFPSEPVQRDGFTDYPIIIGEHTGFPIVGILSMPDGAAEPIPAAVIVQGSGASDMDGTIGGNRPYRDIAEFLAANGIAVVRADKRTYTHGVRIVQELGGYATVWEETVEDALFATELLRADRRIDENRIFIIGHSLGGTLAPRIHASNGNFAGLILMATTPRSLPELFLEQMRASSYAGVEEGLIDESVLEAALEELYELAELLDTIKNMTAEEARITQIPGLGVWAYYLADLEAHSFEAYISRVNVPILVMQGLSDFQVIPTVDLILLQELLEGRDNVSFNIYNGLDHLFMETTATNFVQHAMRIIESPGHVDEIVLKDIVDWINEH